MKQTLKLMAVVTNCQDILDLKMRLLFANTQAVIWITEGSIFFFKHPFLTSDK